MQQGQLLNVKSKQKVMVHCPNDHNLFPDGIAVKTLYDNFGVRLSDEQVIKKEQSSFVTGIYVSRKGEDPDVAIQRARLDAYLLKFRLGEGQFKLLKRVCPECK